MPWLCSECTKSHSKKKKSQKCNGTAMYLSSWGALADEYCSKVDVNHLLHRILFKMDNAIIGSQASFCGYLICLSNG